MFKKCRSCWWQEGDSCYNKILYTDEIVPRNSSGRSPCIVEDHYIKCNSLNAWEGKRSMLEKFFPSEKLIILSELNEN